MQRSLANEKIADAVKTEQPGRRFENRVSSQALRVTPDGVMFFRRQASADAKAPFSFLDLREVYLPAVPFLAEAPALIDRADLCTALIRVVDNYLLQARATKSSHLSAICVARRVIKFFEYGWINGIYELGDWTKTAADELAKKLAAGGWVHALDLVDRIQSGLTGALSEELHSMWTVSRSGDRKIVPARLKEVLRTNIDTQEIYSLRRWLAWRMVDRYPELASIGSDEKPHHERGASWLRAELTTINLLSEVLSTPRLMFLPYPKPQKIAMRLGTMNSARTQSLSPEGLSEVLQEAFRWLYEIGPPLERVASELVAWHQKHARDRRALRLPARAKLEMSEHLPFLEEKLGRQLTVIGRTRRSPGGLSLDSIFSAFFSAAFIVVACMNARRKDEIQHQYIGLFNGCLVTVDQALGLHVCEFYIEKTVLDYVPFYVNGATRDAILALERLSRIAREHAKFIERPHVANGGSRGPTLFAIPCLTKGLRWFDFGANLAGNDRYAFKAFRTEKAPVLKAHMLRRAHGLLHHYRYDCTSLQALCQQMQHHGIETTVVYVSDSAKTALSERGAQRYGKLTPSQQRALDLEEIEREQDRKEIGAEKLLALVEQVIAGRRRGVGAFEKLVQRFHQVLGKSVSYARLDTQRQGAVLGNALISKGYSPHPFWHSNCMAGTTRLKSPAHCYDENSNVLERSRASPSLCMGCMHQQVADQHVQNMEDEVPRLSAEITRVGPSTIIGKRIATELRLLEDALSLCRKRVGR